MTRSTICFIAWIRSRISLMEVANASAVIGHLLLVPTPANTENEPARGSTVDTSLAVWIHVLDDKTDPRRKLDGFRHRGGSS